MWVGCVVDVDGRDRRDETRKRELKPVFVW